MARVLTFSQNYPSYHPRAGQLTLFVEQVLNALGIDYNSEKYLKMLYDLNSHNDKLSKQDIVGFFMGLGMLDDSCNEKLHTIRAGHRWKQGELASPRVWSVKPYASPQIIFAPDTEVVRTYDIYMGPLGELDINKEQSKVYFTEIAKNDGLSPLDMNNWFIPEPDKFKGFDGQIIAWKDPKY